MTTSSLSPLSRGRMIDIDNDLEQYCARAIEVGATAVKQVDPRSVVTAPWVKLKCQFGCPGFGKGHCCTSKPLLTNNHRKCGRYHAIRENNGCPHLWGAFR